MAVAAATAAGIAGSVVPVTEAYAAAPAAPASASTASFLKLLSGPSEAAMYSSGLTYDTIHNRLVVADSGFNRIDFYDPTTGKLQSSFGSYGTANGQFNTDRQVAVDNSTDSTSGDIFVADAGNNRIQAFDQNGNFLWTAGGLGSCAACINTPIGITFDPTNDTTPGDLPYVIIASDTGQSLIKAFNPLNGAALWTSPKTLNLASPRDAIVGPDGRLWIDDYHHQEVKAYDVQNMGGPTPTWPTTTPLQAITLGDGLSGGHALGELNFPYNIQFSPDGKTAYVADTGNERVARWDVSQSPPAPLSPFGSRCPTPCPLPPGNAAYFLALRRVVVDPIGNVWASDFWGGGIHEFHTDGSTGLEIAGAPAPAPGFAEAFGITIGSDGATYGVDRLNQRIERFDANGKYLNDVGQRGTAAGTFSWPETAAVAPDHTLWVGDTRNDRLQHFAANLSGTPAIAGSTGTAPGQFSNIEGVAVDAAGVVWVADSSNNRIQAYDPSTSTFTTYGLLGSSNGQFTNPEGVAVSPTDIYVADTLNNRIVDLSHSGTSNIQFVGSQSSAAGVPFNNPQGVALGPDGTVWVADSLNNRIVHLSATLQDLGDTFGGPDTTTPPGNSEFFQPHSLAVSPAGSPNPSVLFVADTYNNRVQEYSLPFSAGQPAKLAFTNQPSGATAGSPFNSQPAVSVEDSGGNIVTTDTSTVTLSITSGTGASGAALSCSGGLSQTAVSGVATFTGCVINNSGPGYTLTATDGSLTLATSAPFFVSTGGAPTWEREIFNAGGIAPLYPAAGVTDAAGNRYIANSGNSDIVKMDSSGSCCTVVSTAVSDPRAIVFDTNGTDLWVASTSSSTVVEMSQTGTLEHTFGTGLLKNPYGLDNDSTGVYVADTYNKRVVKLDKTTGAILTGWPVSSCLAKAFGRDRGLAVGSDGNIYVADTDNNRIVVLSPSGTCLASFGSKGTGPGQFDSPWTLLSDGAGGLWIADAMNYRVEHVSNSGTFISATGSFGTGIGQFRAPHGLFMDGGLLDVADPYVYSIQRFTISAGALTYSSTLGGVQPAAGGFNGAFAAAYGPRGELYVLDWFNDRVEKFNPDGTFAMQWGGYGSTKGSFIFPRGIAVTPDGKTVVVTNSEDNRIDLFSSTGTYVGTVKPSGTTFSRPQQSVVAPDGTYWVADTLHNRVIHLNSAGAVLSTFTKGGAMKTPQGIAMDAEGNLYVSDSGNNAVEKYDQSGNLLSTLATQGSGATNVSTPYAISVAGSPGQETLLIGDAGNNRILELGTNGSPVLSFGASGSADGQLSSPRGAVLNPITGELAVADFANNRVSVWATATAASSGKYVMSPSPIAATGSLGAGAGVTVSVTAEDSGGTPIAGASIYLAFTPASGGGSASVGATALSGTPQAFTADGSGVVSVSYTAPATLPNGGTDTLTAQNTSSSPTASASDGYTFAPTTPPIASLAFSPVTIAAPGSLTASTSVISVVTAKGSGGLAVAGATVYLSFSGAGGAKVGGIALSGTPQSFSTDSNGHVSITFTTPGALPATGTDTITAGNAAVSPPVSKSTAYSYGVPASYALTPTPIAATGSLPASKSVTVRLRVLDSSSGSLAGATVYLSFTQAPSGGTASVRGAPLTSTPVAYITDSTGAIAITYTTPATLPASGTDTINAANATSSPTITASTGYTF